MAEQVRSETKLGETMIREWRLGQFKSVAFLQSFPMRPLTVFAGPNSSGKSSVLQSILLISQTLASKVSKRQLVLNGELLKLGTFEDVRSHASESDEINVGFTLDIQPMGPPTISERRPAHALLHAFRTASPTRVGSGEPHLRPERLGRPRLRRKV